MNPAQPKETVQRAAQKEIQPQREMPLKTAVRTETQPKTEVQIQPETQLEMAAQIQKKTQPETAIQKAAHQKMAAWKKTLTPRAEVQRAAHPKTTVWKTIQTIAHLKPTAHQPKIIRKTAALKPAKMKLQRMEVTSRIQVEMAQMKKL